MCDAYFIDAKVAVHDNLVYRGREAYLLDACFVFHSVQSTSTAAAAEKCNPGARLQQGKVYKQGRERTSEQLGHTQYELLRLAQQHILQIVPEKLEDWRLLNTCYQSYNHSNESRNRQTQISSAGYQIQSDTRSPSCRPLQGAAY